MEQKCKVTLNIWDTTGQEKYRALCPLYFREADAALLVFDLTNQSVEELKEWLSLLYNQAPENIPIFLVGNKLDLLDTDLAVQHGGTGEGSDQQNQPLENNADEKSCEGNQTLEFDVSQPMIKGLNGENDYNRRKTQLMEEL